MSERYDQKLVEFLVDRLDLLDPLFAEEFLAVIDASGVAWVAPDEATEIMRWNSGLRNGQAHDAYINMRDACLAERRGEGA